MKLCWSVHHVGACIVALILTRSPSSLRSSLSLSRQRSVVNPTPTMSGSTPAIRRIKREYQTLSKSSTSFPSQYSLGFIARPLESNYLHCHFLLFGLVFHDTPYEGGLYHGVLQFPKTYPNSPPSVILRTPSGRFTPSKKICFSMSDYHPELWNPMWAVKSILIGLTSFMNGEELTTGGVRSEGRTKVEFARKSFEVREMRRL